MSPFCASRILWCTNPEVKNWNALCDSWILIVASMFTKKYHKRRALTSSLNVSDPIAADYLSQEFSVEIHGSEEKATNACAWHWLSCMKWIIISSKWCCCIGTLFVAGNHEIIDRLLKPIFWESSALWILLDGNKRQTRNRWLWVEKFSC